jgi:hypothetical protein
MVYQWKPGTIFPKAKAQRVGEHLEQLRNKLDRLTARAVLADARNPNTPTHSLFEWNDHKAAAAYRVEQAERVLRAIEVVIHADDHDPITTRAFVVVSDGARNGYTSAAVAMGDPLLRAQVLARALKELESWQRKYHDLEELADLFAVIDARVAVTAGAR